MWIILSHDPMPIDFINGVGYELRTNPAIQTKVQVFPATLPGNTPISEMVIEDNVSAFLELKISFLKVAGGITPTPTITLFRNGQQIDQLRWALNYQEIGAQEGTRVMYFFRTPTLEVLRRGSTLRLVVTQIGGAADSRVDITFNFSLRGLYF